LQGSGKYKGGGRRREWKVQGRRKEAEEKSCEGGGKGKRMTTIRIPAASQKWPLMVLDRSETPRVGTGRGG